MIDFLQNFKNGQKQNKQQKQKQKQKIQFSNYKFPFINKKVKPAV